MVFAVAPLFKTLAIATQNHKFVSYERFIVFSFNSFSIEINEKIYKQNAFLSFQKYQNVSAIKSVGSLPRRGKYFNEI